MIKPIMKDVLFLAQKSEPATAKDKNIAIDLLDTLQANADRCVGMAANMIGERKRCSQHYGIGLFLVEEALDSHRIEQIEL